MVSALTTVSSPVGRATFPGALVPGIGTIMQSEQTSEGIDLALLTSVERRNLGVDSKPKSGGPSWEHAPAHTEVFEALPVGSYFRWLTSKDCSSGEVLLKIGHNKDDRFNATDCNGRPFDVPQHATVILLCIHDTTAERLLFHDDHHGEKQ